MIVTFETKNILSSSAKFSERGQHHSEGVECIYCEINRSLFEGNDIIIKYGVTTNDNVIVALFDLNNFELIDGFETDGKEQKYKRITRKIETTTPKTSRLSLRIGNKKSEAEKIFTINPNFSKIEDTSYVTIYDLKAFIKELNEVSK